MRLRSDLDDEQLSTISRIYSSSHVVYKINPVRFTLPNYSEMAQAALEITHPFLPDFPMMIHYFNRLAVARRQTQIATLLTFSINRDKCYRSQLLLNKAS